MALIDGVEDENGIPTRSFYVDQTEVTVSMFADYLRESQDIASGQFQFYQADARCNYGAPDRLDHPMNCIAWDAARKYCNYYGKSLPTVRQWEASARAAGLVVSRTRAQTCPGDYFDDPVTCPVSRVGSASGIGGIIGNVHEMTLTTLQLNPRTPLYYLGRGAPRESEYPVLMGSFYSEATPFELPAAEYHVLRYPWSIEAPHIGFRCVERGRFTQSETTYSPEAVRELVDWLESGELGEEREYYSAYETAGSDSTTQRSSDQGAGPALVGDAQNDCIQRIPCFGQGDYTGMVYIPGGTFEMGSAAFTYGDVRFPARRVTLRPYWIDIRPVKAQEFKGALSAVMETRNAAYGRWNPADITGGLCRMGRREFDGLPVNCVNYEAAAAYCRAKGKSLPTEAQWEFAAVGASASMQAGTAANSGDFYYQMTNSAPGVFPGLENLGVGMSEWTQDTFTNYGNGAETDPVLRADRSEYRTVKGRAVGGQFDALFRRAVKIGTESLYSTDVQFRCVKS